MATSTTKTPKQPRTARQGQPLPPTKIRLIGGDLYWTSSYSHPGTGHHTTPESCTCPAGLHARMCRHRVAVRAYHTWRMQQIALAGIAAAEQDYWAVKGPPGPASGARQVEEWTEDGVRYVPASRQGELRPLPSYFE
jgi:hypothetical protein